MPTAEHPGTRYLYAESSARPGALHRRAGDGRGRGASRPRLPVHASTRAPALPLHGGTLTRRVQGLLELARLEVAIHPSDARRLGVDTGCASLARAAASSTLRARHGVGARGRRVRTVREARRIGGELLTTPPATRVEDPEYKVCAVRIERLRTRPLKIPSSRPSRFACPSRSRSRSRRAATARPSRRSSCECNRRGDRRDGETRRASAGQRGVALEPRHTVKDHFEPMITGRSPFDVAGIVHRAERDPRQHALRAGRRGRCAIRHRRQGRRTAVHKLSRRVPDRVRIAGLLAMKPTVAELWNPRGLLRSRFSSLRAEIGVDPRQDLAKRRGAPEPLRDRIVLRVDANGALSYDAALSLLRKLEPYDIDAASSRSRSGTWRAWPRSAGDQHSIMADESVSTDHSLLEGDSPARRHGGADEIAKNGGMYRVWRLWALASAAGMRIYPETTRARASRRGVAQLCAAWPARSWRRVRGRRQRSAGGRRRDRAHRPRER